MSPCCLLPLQGTFAALRAAASLLSEAGLWMASKMRTQGLGSCLGMKGSLKSVMVAVVQSTWISSGSGWL